MVFISILKNMNKLVLLLGGNMGDREAVFNSAIDELSSSLGDVVLTSSLFESEAWGFESDNMFLNQVVVVDTARTADDCLKITQGIEKLLGRVRHKQRYSSRLIDIDLLFYNDDIVNTPDLIIPHPRIQERNFVLEPLNEVMPDFVHPLLNKKISTLLVECTDQCKVY